LFNQFSCFNSQAFDLILFLQQKLSEKPIDSGNINNNQTDLKLTNYAQLSQLNPTPTFNNNFNISELKEVYNNNSFNQNPNIIPNNIQLNDVKYIPNFKDENNLPTRGLGNQLINNLMSFQPMNSLTQGKKIEQDNLNQIRNKQLKEKFFEIKGKLIFFIK
jgi:hypothetical protein